MSPKKKKGKRNGSILLDSVFYDSMLESLTFSAFRLFIELNQQYNTFNNGNLSAAQGNLRFDWNDKTLKTARTELIKAGVIELTRMGRKRKPNLYALTHLPINECEKHNIKGRETCTNRAIGKREHYFPVRVDIQAKLRVALSKSRKLKG